MITTKITEDYGYIASELSKPGILRNVSAGLPIGDINEAISGDNLFVQVEKDGVRAGFVAFHRINQNVADIHVVLKTMGEDTINAIRQALDIAKEAGLTMVLAIFLDSKKSLRILSDKLGFNDEGNFTHQGLKFSVKTIKLT